MMDLMKTLVSRVTGTCTLSTLGDHARAVRVYRRMISHGEASISVYFLLAKSLSGLGDTVGALQALQVYPTAAPSRETSEFREAESLLNQLLEQ